MLLAMIIKAGLIIKEKSSRRIQFNKILNVGTPKVCFLCLEFISGHFRTRGWRRDLLEEEQLNTL